MIRRFLAGLRPRQRWAAFWMARAGLGPAGRLATRAAELAAPPYKGRQLLARFAPRGYVASTAVVRHPGLRLGRHVYVGDRVVVFQAHPHAGAVVLDDRVHLYPDTIIEVGARGSVTIGSDTYIQPRCQLSAYEAPIRIGRGVQIAPFCAFYPYDHGFAPGEPIQRQPLTTKGGIVIEDDAWLGVGVTVLDGVRIGEGAVVGAGAVVTEDVPEGAIAAGVPARVVKYRDGRRPQTPGRRPRELAA
jgi:acetyltransferase-like isoleucine patch superfamily enzyme